MKTQTFKAKDVKSAINLVNTEFGDKAIILSTKKNNGFVEVEASDNEDIIFEHKKKVEENKNFSNVFLKELKTKNIHSTLNDKNKVSVNNLVNTEWKSVCKSLNRVKGKDYFIGALLHSVKPNIENGKINSNFS